MSNARTRQRRRQVLPSIQCQPAPAPSRENASGPALHGSAPTPSLLRSASFLSAQRIGMVRGLQATYGNRFVQQLIAPSANAAPDRREDGFQVAAVSPDVRSPGGGQPLETGIRAFMEERFGEDFSDVRVHADSKADGAAESLNAQAFTTGRDIYFGANHYQPLTSTGRGLVAHELAHVVQQKSGARASGVSRVDDPHERAAEQAAGDIARGRRPSPGPGGPAPAMQRQAQPGTPPNLAPPPLPAETEEERLNRMLSETAREEEARREITRADQPAPAPTVAPSETSLAEAVRRMLATCEAVQRQAAERREVVPPAAARERQAGQDPVAALKQRIEACLDTKEGQRVQAMAKELLLSRKGAPITVSAYLASILVTGRVPFIPSIPLGDELELSISVEGKVTQPAGGMVTLKFSGVPSWLESAAKAVGRGAATVGGAIWSGLKAVGGAVWSGLKTAGSAIWSGLKTVGGAIWSGVKAVGGAIATAAGAMWTGIRWVARQLWDKVTGIFARITQWIARLPERVGRLLLGLWEGVKSLKPWSLDWWASLGRATTWVNFLKWLGTRLIDLLEIAGVGEIYETVADFIKFNTRTLTDAEVRKASAVFGDSINYRLVRVDEAAVLGPAFSKREYTSFHTINGWGRMTDDILMHELTHVWQYEHAGAIYMPQAIHAQIWGAGYNYGGAAGLQAAKAAGQRITDFNREQQAQIVQDFSNMRQSDPDIALYASFVEQVSTLTAAQLIAGRPP